MLLRTFLRGGEKACRDHSFQENAHNAESTLKQLIPFAGGGRVCWDKKVDTLGASNNGKLFWPPLNLAKHA